MTFIADVSVSVLQAVYITCCSSSHELDIPPVVLSLQQYNEQLFHPTKKGKTNTAHAEYAPSTCVLKGNQHVGHCCPDFEVPWKNCDRCVNLWQAMFCVAIPCRVLWQLVYYQPSQNQQWHHHHAQEPRASPGQLALLQITLKPSRTLVSMTDTMLRPGLHSIP